MCVLAQRRAAHKAAQLPGNSCLLPREPGVWGQLCDPHQRLLPAHSPMATAAGSSKPCL